MPQINLKVKDVELMPLNIEAVDRAIKRASASDTVLLSDVKNLLENISESLKTVDQVSYIVVSGDGYVFAFHVKTAWMTSDIEEAKLFTFEEADEIRDYLDSCGLESYIIQGRNQL